MTISRPSGPVLASGHVLPLPPLCAWCGEPATADSICPSSIPCSRCDAGPGERCRLPNGHATTLHQQRREDARALKP